MPGRPRRRRVRPAPAWGRRRPWKEVGRSERRRERAVGAQSSHCLRQHTGRVLQDTVRARDTHHEAQIVLNYYISQSQAIFSRYPVYQKAGGPVYEACAGMWQHVRYGQHGHAVRYR